MAGITLTQLVLMLHSVPQIGDRSLARTLRYLAQRRMAPDAFLDLRPEVWNSQCGLHAAACAYLLDNRTALIAASAVDARLVATHGLHVVTEQMAAYPARLVQAESEPPPVLYLVGRTDLLDAARPGRFTFAVAVSNGAPPAVLERCDSLAGHLIDRGGVPVTGHDRKAYQRLALCAQRRNASTLYVLDRGLREALGANLDRPLFAAARIRESDFAAGRDVCVSPFRMTDHGIGGNNRRRDRLVFALADVVVAAYVRPGGTMEAECRQIAARGRAFLSLPGSGVDYGSEIALEPEVAAERIAAAVLKAETNADGSPERRHVIS